MTARNYSNLFCSGKCCDGRMNDKLKVRKFATAQTYKHICHVYRLCASNAICAPQSLANSFGFPFAKWGLKFEQKKKQKKI